MITVKDITDELQHTFPEMSDAYITLIVEARINELVKQETDKTFAVCVQAHIQILEEINDVLKPVIDKELIQEIQNIIDNTKQELQES